MNAADLTTLSKALELALPVLATLLSGLLSQDKFPEWLNALLAATCIALAALATVFLRGQLTGNVVTDVGIITAVAMSLQATVLAPLHRFLKSSVFVYAPKTTVQPVVVQKPPEAIQLPVKDGQGG